LREQPVLVVDDDPYILDVVSAILTNEGYEVMGAANGAEAFRSISKARPCVVLLDMVMPVLDGWEFIELSKTSGLNLPIVIMTASKNAATLASEVGAADYLGKPFDLDELSTKVARFHDTRYELSE
jgi:DNA-binding NtrC family response regulator